MNDEKLILMKEAARRLVERDLEKKGKEIEKVSVKKLKKLYENAYKNLYNKLRYGLGHEIKEIKDPATGKIIKRIYTCLKWIDEYNSVERRGASIKRW